MFRVIPEDSSKILGQEMQRYGLIQMSQSVGTVCTVSDIPTRPKDIYMIAVHTEFS